jgi:hypothetical protein
MHWRALAVSLCVASSFATACKGDDVQIDDSDGTGDGTGDGDGDTGDGDGDGDGDELPDPGRVTIHRLNNAEYNNTVRDLFFGMVDWAPANEFPADVHGFGFDNISDVQTLSPLHFELYQRAAETMVADALRVAAMPELFAWEAESEEVTQTIGGPGGDGGFWMLWSNGEVYNTFEASAGTYVFSTRAYATQAGPDLAHMALTVDEVIVYETDIAAIQPELAEVHDVEIQLDAGIISTSTATCWSTGCRSRARPIRSPTRSAT